jgi:hypothetical protein
MQARSAFLVCIREEADTNLKMEKYVSPPPTTHAGAGRRTQIPCPTLRKMVTYVMLAVGVQAECAEPDRNNSPVQTTRVLARVRTRNLQNSSQTQHSDAILQDLKVSSLAGIQLFFFCSRTPRRNFSSTLYPQICRCIIQLIRNLK